MPEGRNDQRSLALGCGVGVAVGAVVTLMQDNLLLRAFADCDIGVNTAANGLVVMLVSPVLWLLNWAGFAAGFWVGSARSTRWPGWFAGLTGVLIGLLALVLVTWGAMAMAMPEGYPSSCVDDAPPWWPSWLPI